MVELPKALPKRRIRALVEIAIENAVEGCVRETYGALVGAVERKIAPDGSIRRAMKAVTADECRHADLAWSVHAWAMPRLSASERGRVEQAMQEAIAALRAFDPRAVDLLFVA